MKRALPAIAVLLVLALVASVGAASSAQPFRVTSSLDGKKVLPIRSRWLAYPKISSAKVAEVDFLIDGKVRCVERYVRYNYGSDDLHGHYGWLVTSWLAPGQHRFTARAILTNGTKASDTVVARVLPAPEPPSALAGRWQRTVTEGEVAKVDPTSDLPVGRWELVFDHIGAWSLDPKGSGVVDHANIHGTRLDVDAAVWIVAGAPQKGVSRYGHTEIGPGWREDGPPASYRWSVSGNELTLTTIKETTGPYLDRRAVWEGTWTRVP